MQRYLWTLPIALLSCAACSTTEDPSKKRQLGPVLPPYQASLYFVISPPDGGAGCDVSRSGYVANIGGPPNSSRADPGMRSIDGVEFADIRCRVSGSGPFNLSLSAAKSAAVFSLVDGTVAGGSGSATISMAGPGTGSAPLSGVCQLDTSRRPFQVAPGNIWASFVCPSVGNPTQPGACSAQGEFVFENCDE
jgi:hypothetical protein